jgi:hypothetical protein
MLDNVVKSSWIKYKQSRKRRWKKRWVVLRHSGLYLYNDVSEYVVLKILGADMILDVLVTSSDPAISSSFSESDGDLGESAGKKVKGVFKIVCKNRQELEFTGELRLVEELVEQLSLIKMHPVGSH